MDINTIIQVAIGILFVWIILAVVTSEAQGWIASMLAWRAKMLEEYVGHMLGDPALKDKIYNHPLIQSLHTQNGARKPAGIPQDKFALVLFEEVSNPKNIEGLKIAGQDAKTAFEQLRRNISALKAIDENDANNATEEQKRLKKIAASLDTLMIGIEERADKTVDDFTEARKRVEDWFNNSMDRLGGAYSRRMQVVAIVVGIIVAAVLNADTAKIATTLWQDPVLRQQITAQASQLHPVLRQEIAAQASQLQASDVNPPAGQSSPTLQNMQENADKLSALPIGWSKANLPQSAGEWAVKVFGILISGLAASQGAPYWFDLMRKLINR